MQNYFQRGKMPTTQTNLNTMPNDMVRRAHALFYTKGEYVTETGCYNWRGKSNYFQANSYSGTVNQWICFLKYHKASSTPLKVCPIVCGNVYCINIDHLIIKELEDNLNQHRSSPFWLTQSRTGGQPGYNTPFIDYPVDKLDDLKRAVMTACIINTKGCWIFKNNTFRFNAYTGSMSQAVALIKYKFILHSSRIILERLQCKTKNCYNPDHVISHVYQVEQKERLSSNNHIISLPVQEKQNIKTQSLEIDMNIKEEAQKMDGFNNEALSRAVYNLSQASTAILDQLDNCSDDIRKLEEFLESSTLGTPYRIDISLKLKTKDDWYELKKLSWSPHNDGKFRLMLSYHLNESSDLKEFPLLQMPAMVRLKGSAFMTQLVEYIVEHI